VPTLCSLFSRQRDRLFLFFVVMKTIDLDGDFQWGSY